MLNRRLLAMMAAAAVLSVILLVIPAYGGAFAARSDPAQLQTWPSRTPTSDAGPPPDGGQTPGGGESGGPASPTPSPPAPGQEGTAVAATATSSTATQAASSPAPTGTQLPDSAFLATAEPCGLPPTALVVEAATVHLGPGDEYGLAGRLRLLAVRPVIGRAAHAPWWLVALENGQAGWVPDQAVIIHGHTGAVEVIEAPFASGQTPKPLQMWNPTPNPICLTPQPVPADQSGGAPQGSQNAITGGETSAGGEASVGDAPAAEPFGSESGLPVAELSGQPAGDSVAGGPQAAVPSDPESASDQRASLGDGNLEDKGGGLTWLLAIGIVMILGGAIAFLLQTGASRSGSSS